MGEPGAEELRRAGSLLRFYPRDWRERYGVEFAELLAADFVERPRCWRRTADVMAQGLRARVSPLGVPGRPVDPAEQVRAGLVAVGYALAAFLIFGLAMWSQVAIGWRWRPPSSPVVAAGMVSMTATIAVTALLIVSAAVPFIAAFMKAVFRRQVRLLRPGAVVVASLAVLVAGGLHFDTHWPGSGGRPWGSHGLVPSGIAAFCWAITRGVSAYWFHPHALARFHAVEIVWMATSLAAIAALVAGSSTIVRRLQLSPRALRFEATLARVALAVMALFAAGAAAWVVAGRPVGPTGVYSVGMIDVICLGMLALALLTTRHALARIALAGSAR